MGDRTARVLLLAGMAMGLAAAAYSLVSGAGLGLPDDAVARVGDRIVTRDAWRRAVAAVASERRTPLTGDDERRILDRLIDEELLVQHGLGLGLVESDRRLRGQLVAEAIASATTNLPIPDEAAQRRYYDAHRDYFATPGRLRVAVTASGRPFSPPVPDALLPPAKLREYLGPRLLEVALALDAGAQAQGPGPDGAAVTLRVLEKEPSQAPAFEDVRDAVRDAAVRDAQERALRTLLARLRDDTGVTLRTDTP